MIRLPESNCSMDIHGANGSWRMELHSIYVIYWLYHLC